MKSTQNKRLFINKSSTSWWGILYESGSELFEIHKKEPSNSGCSDDISRYIIDFIGSFPNPGGVFSHYCWGSCFDIF